MSSNVAGAHVFVCYIFKICCQLLGLCLCRPHRAPLPDSLVILSTLLVCQPVHGKNPAGVHAVIRTWKGLPERIEPLLHSKEDRSSLDSHQDVQQWMPSNWHYTTTTRPTRRFRRFDGSIRLRGQTLPVERRLTHMYHI